MRERIRVQRAPATAPVAARGARARMERPASSPVSVASRAGADFTAMAVTSTAGRAPDTARRIEQASQTGSAIEPAARALLEQRMGADLDAVRIHADGTADALSRELHANAFTTGSEIFFSAGAYDPASAHGLRLLAHEVAHTLQQAAGPVDGVAAPGGIVVSEPGDRFERAAEATAESAIAEAMPGEAVTDASVSPAVATPAPASPSTGAGAYVQRDTLDDIARFAGLGGTMIGAGLSGAGMASAAPWVTGPIAAGIAGAYGGKALHEHTSVGQHTQDVLGGFDAMMTDPGERSWLLRQYESTGENWDKGNYGDAILSGAKVAGGGLLGALGGIGGGLVDAGSWLGKKIF